MSASLTLLFIVAVFYGVGVYIMLERSLTRILIGFLLVGNGTNILIFLMSGRPGEAPIITDSVTDFSQMSDPLPQAFILTAIVINLGITAFLLAVIYRSWWLSRLGDTGDQVVDDELEEEEALEADVVFEQAEGEGEAIQHALELSNEGEEEAELETSVLELGKLSEGGRREEDE